MTGPDTHGDAPEPRELAVVEDAVVVDDTPVPELPGTDYNLAGVPSFDYVRDRIESRFATSTGAVELSGDAVDTTSVDEQLAERERAGRAKLEEIRRSMRGE
jgi:hypothetical protein